MRAARTDEGFGHGPLFRGRNLPESARIRQYLTLVIERTSDPTTWLTVTGWDATARERRLLESR